MKLLITCQIKLNQQLQAHVFFFWGEVFLFLCCCFFFLSSHTIWECVTGYVQPVKSLSVWSGLSLSAYRITEYCRVYHGTTRFLMIVWEITGWSGPILQICPESTFSINTIHMLSWPIKVNHHMRLHVLFLGESLPTNLAWKRFFASMYTIMSSQSGNIQEPFTTLSTNILTPVWWYCRRYHCITNAENRTCLVPIYTYRRRINRFCNYFCINEW